MLRSHCLRRWPLLGVFGVLGACVTTPPVQEMSDARQAIAAAVDAEAGRHAPETLAEARRFLETAQEQLQEEAYGSARLNAVRAKNRASQALTSSQALSGSAADFR
jgi:hypothetical protein